MPGASVLQAPLTRTVAETIRIPIRRKLDGAPRKIIKQLQANSKAGDIALLGFPEPPSFRKRRPEVRNKVKAARRDPNKAFNWTEEVEGPTKPVGPNVLEGPRR